MSQAGHGLANRNPWARVHPSAIRVAAATSVSTPSATICRPNEPARPMIERTMARSWALIAQVADEPAVDLEYVDRQGFELGERAVAGAEIVDGDVDADVLEPAEGGQRLLRVADNAFSVISSVRCSGVEIAARRIRADGVDEVDGDQFRRRDIDAQPIGSDRGTPVPLLQLPAAGFEHPAAEFAGQVGGFDRFDEGAGWQQTEVGVRPSHQCLDSERSHR